jgi:hypothetical protein
MKHCQTDYIKQLLPSTEIDKPSSEALPWRLVDLEREHNNNITREHNHKQLTDTHPN